MKVFISSVRRGLEAERDYLPDLIRANGHEPLRFEDFGAQDLTSRGACLGGVQDSDVYLLILGPHYGGEMDDTGISATEEEFNTATSRGIPIYVFRKTGESPDPEQQDFMGRVGNYQEGRFWKDFSDNGQLGIAVTKALHEHKAPAAQFTQLALDQAVTPNWRVDQTSIPAPRDGNAVLEVHVLPIDPTPLRSVAGMGDLASTLATHARQQGFFGHGDAIDINTDGNSAWAIRESGGHRNRHSQEATADPFAGIYLTRDGSVSIFQALPRHPMGMGSFVNENDLTQRITVLLRHITPYLPDAANITTAAAIDPSEWVNEGDPATVNAQRGISLGFNRSTNLRADPADQIAKATLPPHLQEVARELSARLMQTLRANSR